jgi:dTDP-4-amino-4,6-dideoxygalactose transaminase
MSPESNEPQLETVAVMRPWIGAEEAAAATDAIMSGWVGQGPRVTAFEEAFARRVGGHAAVALSSCTAALQLALLAAGIGPGDEVVIPSMSFIAAANVVRHVGATPVFGDVDAATLNMTPATIEAVCSSATRAVILVHQVGTPADIDAVRALCDARSYILIEDAACAIGSVYKGQPVGAHSDLVAFSFHPRKIITTGEGGMLVVGRDDWATTTRRLREHGMSVSAAERHARRDVVLESYDMVGHNFRMTDVQAAIGIVQLGRLDAIIARRRELAHRYQEHLREVPGIVRTIDDPPWGLTNYQSFWIELGDDFPMSRDGLLRFFMERAISGRRGVMAAHVEPAYADLPLRAPLPVTEHQTDATIVLPMFHDMTLEQQDRVIDAVREAAGVASASSRPA